MYVTYIMLLVMGTEYMSVQNLPRQNKLLENKERKNNDQDKDIS